MSQKQIKAYLAQIGAKGGTAKSAEKSEAARKNGKLGGRPKKAVKAREKKRKGR